MNAENPDWEIKHRDVVILRELARDPQLSARELTRILADEYDISVSHVTVSQSIKKMRDAGVFREAIIPNESYFSYALFEFRFNTENFAREWRDAMNYIREDEHTLLFFNSNGEYQWKTVMMFKDLEAQSRWIHECYKQHGSVIDNIRSSVMTNVLKFATAPEIFDKLPEK